METFAYRRAEDLPGGAEPHGGPPNLSALLGAWRNTDGGASGGIVQLLLVERDRTLRVHAFGAGAPEPYDWGEIEAVPYAASVASGAAWAFTATYDFGFLETTLSAYTKTGILVLTTYNSFTDGSGRAHYFTREFFHRDRRAECSPSP